VAKSIRLNVFEILQANKKDVAFAKKNKIDAAKLDRLTLDEKKINALASSIEDVAKLPDPVNKILYDVKRDNNLHIQRVTTPIGVLLAIFEARPNVASDIAALAFKAGNAVILRSGSECIHSAKILVGFYQAALKKFNCDESAIYLVFDTDREYVKRLLKMDKFIDVVIPRGGKSLIKTVMAGTKIPVFKHLDGNCHTYINEKCNFEKARKILLNAKLRRVGICGATESLLIDQKIAAKILPLIANDFSDLYCEMRGDAASQKIDHRIKKATEKDYYTEYLDKIISIKIVKNISEAITHINKYSSSHTESIITEDQKFADEFFAKINSAIVMHNASTQFADGGEFGLGAEVGIATGKLHARGPVGLEQLVTYKYVVRSECGIRR
jgi:glutamate-5-semialdehyde dehydrogenase